MSKFKTLLLVIVGRLKMYLDALFITIGGILVPLGFYIVVESPSDNSYGTFLVFVGLVLWLLAYWMVRRKENREKIGRIESEIRENKRREEEQKERKALYDLLIDMREELRRKKNERDNL